MLSEERQRWRSRIPTPKDFGINVREHEVTQVLAWVTFAISLVVALAAALEGFFRYGERRRNFRRTSELLKAHGWQFFELAGPYTAADHSTAFPAFAAQVETLVQQDVEAYIAAMAQTRRQIQPYAGEGAPAVAKEPPPADG
jgi:Protein of unknown function (DUF4231)